MQEVTGIGKITMEKMKAMGIDSIEKLASIKLQDLMKINGIDKSLAIKYIKDARKLLEQIKDKEKKVISREDEPINKRVVFKEIFPLQEPNFPIPKVKEPTDKKAVIGKKVLSKEKQLLNEQLRSQLIKKYYKNKISPKKNTTFKASVNKKTKQEPKMQTPKGKESIYKEIVIEKKVFSKGKEPIDKKVIIKSNYPSKNKIPPKQYSTFKSKPIIKEASIKKKPKKKEIKDKSVGFQSETYFPQEIMQKIRFLHFKIKHLEEFLINKHKEIKLEELDYVWNYVKLLNINYKTKSQIKIFKELNLTPTFYDTIENREINIWDLMFECTRVLWILSRVYAQLSKKYEKENDLKNATIAMVECSKAYKTASYFSAACTRQEDKGVLLSFENLEINSEEARIFAQSIAAIREENKNNFLLASKMYAGLSALSKRLSYLKVHDIVMEHQLKAQSNYDLGKAYHLKAKALLKCSILNENGENIKRLQQKANHYFSKAEGIWEFMRDNFNELSKENLDNLRINLSIVNEHIIENDVEIPDINKIKEIEEIEPFIAVPENLAPIVPRTTMYLTKFGPRNIEYNTFKEFKNKKLDMNFRLSKMEELQNKKAGIGRVIKELKVLNENNDIDINTFFELMEKYSTKLKMLENTIDKLKSHDEKVKTVNKQFKNISVKK